MRHWSLIAVALLSGLAGGVAAKLLSRWTATCGNVPCGYVQLRLSTFDQMVASNAGRPAYLVIGDSLTEIGHWPAMCGQVPVAAGISGARTDTWLPHAKAIADALGPKFIVLALGTNDVLSLGRLGPYEELAESLRGYRLVGVPVHELRGIPQQIVREANARIAKAVERTAEAVSVSTTDGIHLAADDYARWFEAIEAAACDEQRVDRQG